MTETPRILILSSDQTLPEYLTGDQAEKFYPDELSEISQLWQDQNVKGLYLANNGNDIGQDLIRILQAGMHYPDGLALVDTDLKILWSNDQLIRMLDAPQIGTEPYFYDLFGDLEVINQQHCPFQGARNTRETRTNTLKLDDKQYFEVRVTPIFYGADQTILQFLAIVRNTTEQTLHQQKFNAIYQAGLDLGDLSPQEMINLTVDERIELLKCKILHYTQDLLEFDTVEIRLIDKVTKQLRPLLAHGMEKLAEDRKLYAEAEDNGVTGYVAATGESYLCDDTSNDRLYITGAMETRSSMTVPLNLHDEILGTFNVESPLPHAFDEHDLQFLELFSREVAVALNTLDLLAIEKAATMTEGTQKILQQVAIPVDEILSDAAWILERYIGHEPSVSDRLRQILQHTREIKQRIREAGEAFSVNKPHLQFQPENNHPALQNKRILVVDSDESIRRAAHELLGRFGCLVETAHDGQEAIRFIKGTSYDAVIVDIRLTDMTGFECFCQIRELDEYFPVILMTGFGWDPTHSIVKARQMGLKSVLYKPFRLDQLIHEVESAVASSPTDHDIGSQTEPSKDE